MLAHTNYNMNKTRIILDTNFLLIPGQFNVDIFSELRRLCDFAYTLAVVPETITELERIITSRKSSGKDKAAARLGQQMLRKFKVRILSDDRKVFKRADEAILYLSDTATLVATQDKLLKKQLATKGVRRIILRQKRHLALEV
jgi:uncharacterized protein